MKGTRQPHEAASTNDLWPKVDEALRVITSAAKRARDQAAAGNFGAAGKASESLLGAIAKFDGLRNEIASTAREYRDYVERKFAELEADLRSACRSRGWKLDGSWPTLHIERAIRIEVDDEERRVRVCGATLTVPTIENVIATVEPIVSALLPKKFHPQLFVDRLAAAYDDVAVAATQALILDVYRALVIRTQSQQFWRNANSDRFTGLSVEQLSARLSLCLESGCTTSRDGRKLRLLPPLDPRDSIYLYQPAEQRFGYVGRIEFAGT